MSMQMNRASWTVTFKMALQYSCKCTFETCFCAAPFLCSFCDLNKSKVNPCSNGLIGILDYDLSKDSSSIILLIAFLPVNVIVFPL